jgi:hypothetical protein
VSAVLPRIPVCPIPLADESLSSWLDRTACFYGCDLERWVGQFTADFCGYGADIDLDRSDELRFTIGKWSGVPARRLPPSLTCAGDWLPQAGRLTFCDDCWDQDVRNGSQPYIRRHWLKWTTVHCAEHQKFLCEKNRNLSPAAPCSGWQDIWVSRSNWRAALELPDRVVTPSIWYQTSKRLTDGWSGTHILSLFERFDAPDDRKANCALASVLEAWASGNTSDEGSEPPVLLENRIEVLQQAISLLEK